jgi:hypothetical protein
MYIKERHGIFGAIRLSVNLDWMLTEGAVMIVANTLVKPDVKGLQR